MTKTFDRQPDLLKFTTRQLVDELSKRKGVSKKLKQNALLMIAVAYIKSIQTVQIV